MNINTSVMDQVLAAMDLPGIPQDHRIVCAMSGGVDSSVVAGLLKHAGFDVVGITLQLYDHGEAIRRKGACCAGQDIHDARRVSAKLAIPHYVLDYESRFRESVIEDFVDSYIKGATPIPCVRCNQTVKFTDLMWRARELDASALATGHYIRSDKHTSSEHRQLLTPADLARDQSYFLYATTQEQVDFLRFPLGSLTKPQVRDVATEMGLSVADKPDSQDICFVPDGKYADLIAKLRPGAMKPGDIVHLDGRKLGTHEGIVNYTIGQRRGLGIANSEPLYVIKLDPSKNLVIVGPQEALRRNDIILQDVNWLGDEPLSEQPQQVYAKIRSTRPPVEAMVARHNGRIVATIDSGEYGVSPGQACVFYTGQGAGQRVLGGATIA
jgi:tRNA-uridine 2-sulfurtransferase